jgi:hypothetical protein
MWGEEIAMLTVCPAEKVGIQVCPDRRKRVELTSDKLRLLRGNERNEIGDIGGSTSRKGWYSGQGSTTSAYPTTFSGESCFIWHGMRPAQFSVRCATYGVDENSTWSAGRHNTRDWPMLSLRIDVYCIVLLTHLGINCPRGYGVGGYSVRPKFKS